MSLREPKGLLRALAIATGLALATSACTVRPLYMKDDPASAGASAGMAAELASIAVKPVTTRYAQLVRNELIFLLHGGAGETASPRYMLGLNVSSQHMSSATAPASSSDDVNVPTSAQKMTHSSVPRASLPSFCGSQSHRISCAKERSRPRPEFVRASRKMARTSDSGYSGEPSRTSCDLWIGCHCGVTKFNQTAPSRAGCKWISVLRHPLLPKLSPAIFRLLRPIRRI